MNTLGISLLFKSCICMRETVEISGTKYITLERIAVGNYECYNSSNVQFFSNPFNTL